MRLCIFGLGYVGVPLATAFHFAGHEVLGYDIDPRKVQRHQFETTSDLARVKEWNARAYIVTVPTPVNARNRPDLSMIGDATMAITNLIKNGDFVIYESTVYPGMIDLILTPILREGKADIFGVAYSPERINVGDRDHTLTNTKKIVAASDPETRYEVSQLYRSITEVYTVSSIKVAEATKIMENVQRDVNIALMNEFASILTDMDIDVHEVIKAASTKWNFMPFQPGLVGGHCIAVDPYYMIDCANTYSHSRPELMQSARNINERMVTYFTTLALNRLNFQKGSKITILGITFKPNIEDIRNSKAAAVALDLIKNGMQVSVMDDLASPEAVKDAYDIQLVSEAPPADLVMVLVPHRYISWRMAMKLCNESGTVIDIRDAKTWR